jgi:hypothetical protein
MVLEKRGHVVNVESADEWNALVLEFLAGQRPNPG